MMPVLMIYQRPDGEGELERVLEQDEVDDDEHQPGAAEPEQLVRRAHDQFVVLFHVHGGVLRGDLVGQLIYDVLQLRSDQKQELQMQGYKIRKIFFLVRNICGLIVLTAKGTNEIQK
jgi:hypothetical protein